MPVLVKCSSCGGKMNIPDNITTSRAKCPRCGEVFAIKDVKSSGLEAPARTKPNGQQATVPASKLETQRNSQLTKSNSPPKTVKPSAPPPAKVEASSAPPRKKVKPPEPEPDELEEVGADDVIDDEPVVKKKKKPAPVEDQIEDEEPPPDEELPKKKKKKKKKRRSYEEESEGVPTWVWWGVAVGVVCLLMGVGAFIGFRTGHGPLMIGIGIELAIMIPVSTVILIASMFIASALGGGISFGEAHTAIVKSSLLLLVVNLVSMVPFGFVLVFPIWLIGLMWLFDLDLWEARFLVAINWFLNSAIKMFLIVALVAWFMHGKHGGGIGDDFEGPGFRNGPAHKETPMDKAVDKINQLGGNIDDDENADDFVPIGVSLVNSRAKDADLAVLKEFPALKRLDLTNCPGITDQGLTYLKNNPQLQFVILKGTKVTDAGIAEIQKSLPKTKFIR